MELTHEDFPAKLAWYDDLAQAWSHPADAPAVLCGDFNVVPAALDSWRGEDGDGRIFHTVEERQRLAALLGLGLCDLYRETHPESRAFSWWDYRGGASIAARGCASTSCSARGPSSTGSPTPRSTATSARRRRG